MEIDIKEIGAYKGMRVWICDYRRPDVTKKPIRNVPPTLVEVVPAGDVDKTVYYSNYCFKKVKNNGSLSHKIIQPFDDTGFRSRTGCPVSVFEKKYECQGAWNTQLFRVQQLIEKEKENWIERWDSELKDLDDKKLYE